MWRKVCNSSDVQPTEVDSTSSKNVVYVRKNFVFIEETENSPAHWEYDEARLTPHEYELYQDNVALRDYLDIIS